jgi:hypothetical protein
VNLRQGYGHTVLLFHCSPVRSLSRSLSRTPHFHGLVTKPNAHSRLQRRIHHMCCTSVYLPRRANDNLRQPLEPVCQFILQVMDIFDNLFIGEFPGLERSNENKEFGGEHGRYILVWRNLQKILNVSSTPMGFLAERTLSVAKTTLVTFSLTADLATLVKRAITSYFLIISAIGRSRAVLTCQDPQLLSARRIVAIDM